MILAGDIGGTKTILALFEPSEGELRLVREQTFPSRSYPTFDQILDEFFQRHSGPGPSAACFGAAGMVVAGRTHTTNLPWDLDERTLARQFGVTRARLLNDVEAAAYGMLHLKPEEMSVLRASQPARPEGHIAVIAAGTGLGEAMLYWDGDQFHPIASEGGHADFGPNSPEQVELLQYLAHDLDGHVSWERVLSGPGFFRIYRFLRDTGRFAESADLAEKLKQGDPNMTIARLGLERTDPLCVATLELFCSIYGSEAGNLALRCVALGGVFVAGGIAPKLLPAIQRGGFLRSFEEKGRFREFLSKLNVAVSLNPRAPLLGAAYYAQRLASAS